MTDKDSTHSFVDLRQKIDFLPKDPSIEEKIKKSANSYLDALREGFIGLLDNLDEHEFHHFAKYSEISSCDRKNKLKNRIEKRISSFNEICLESLKPSCTESTANKFKELFFDKSNKCRHKEEMTETLKTHTDFYRIRGVKEGYKLYKQSELYTISPSNSSIVSTARFNLSGYPCLYLCESLYLAWEECRRPEFHNANFARFHNSRPLTVFCLTIPENLNSENLIFRAYLSLVCSVKSNDEDKDHWQYRISNLFIKMLSQTGCNEIDGIKYLSSKRFEKEDFQIEYSRENAAYVFPPKDIHETDHCKRLAQMFEMTKPYSYFYFKLHSLHFKSTSKALTRLYDDTVFAFLEEQLKREPTTPCIEIIKDIK